MPSETPNWARRASELPNEKFLAPIRVTEISQSLVCRQLASYLVFNKTYQTMRTAALGMGKPRSRNPAAWSPTRLRFFSSVFFLHTNGLMISSSSAWTNYWSRFHARNNGSVPVPCRCNMKLTIIVLHDSNDFTTLFDCLRAVPSWVFFNFCACHGTESAS